MTIFLPAPPHSGPIPCPLPLPFCVAPLAHLPQQPVHAGLCRDGAEFIAVGHDQAHALGHDVDDPITIASAPHAPVDPARWPAIAERDQAGAGRRDRAKRRHLQTATGSKNVDGAARESAERFLILALGARSVAVETRDARSGKFLAQPLFKPLLFSQIQVGNTLNFLKNP